MKEITDFIQAIVELLWPAFAFTVFLTYRKEVRVLLQRIRRGKLLGQEIELEGSLQQLERSASQAIIEVTSINSPQSTRELEDDTEENDVSRKILQDAASSPKAALLILASELERELRRLLASTGWDRGQRLVGLRPGIDILAESNLIPANLGGAVRLFSEMRNRLVHGHSASDDDILRAIDSGLTILKAVRAVPHESNVVAHIDVPLYSDEHGRTLLVGVTGVILETTSPGGARKEHRICPTTQKHFVPGMRVAWESNQTNIYGPTWFRNPATNALEKAFHSSMEFIGRDLDDV